MSKNWTEIAGRYINLQNITYMHVTQGKHREADEPKWMLCIYFKGDRPPHIICELAVPVKSRTEGHRLIQELLGDDLDHPDPTENLFSF